MNQESRDGSPSERPAPTSVERVRAALRAARDGDKQAFDQIFDRCFDAIYALAWKLSGDRARAERLTENALVCAVEALLANQDEPHSALDPARESAVLPHLDL
jgi:hypothetical protein